MDHLSGNLANVSVFDSLPASLMPIKLPPLVYRPLVLMVCLSGRFCVVGECRFCGLAGGEGSLHIGPSVDGGPFPRFSGVVVPWRRGKERTIQVSEAVNALSGMTTIQVSA
ncbi:hypothetical protein [Caballeronia sp. RCC_10]|uniref:hypothetical protein n=1 Tax=Caballeronia sp. RCC_10 TaxID=3239227 RepID=UPI0035261FA3